MYKPSQAMLRDLRRAVKASRVAHQCLIDLRDNLSPNQFSEQMEDLLKEEVERLELLGDSIPIDFDHLEDLLRTLDQGAP